jgi:hypothetical protein
MHETSSDRLDQGLRVEGVRRRLDNKPTVERTWLPDEGAVLAALRVVLGLQKQPSFGQEA